VVRGTGQAAKDLGSAWAAEEQVEVVQAVAELAAEVAAAARVCPEVVVAADRVCGNPSVAQALELAVGELEPEAESEVGVGRAGEAELEVEVGLAEEVPEWAGAARRQAPKGPRQENG
jgi:hypothetical protein